MLERVIENWLDKTTERSFQQPYCYMLSAEGHTIIHLTRHCGMELGKDIITIAPDGTPCVFQLKTGNISLSRWQTKVSPQTFDLILGKINPPINRQLKAAQIVSSHKRKYRGRGQSRDR